MATDTDPAGAPAPANYDDYLPDDMADIFGLSGGEDPAAAAARPRGEDPAAAAARPRGDAELGIDEEVAVAKRVREPRVKLDESRLLSAKGIPALRQRARVLKLKGKGHEFSDAARLLSLYQLWLDDLFPKARFADALAMVEKEGHKASLHKMRMEWINEAKPGARPDAGAADAEADWDWTQPVEGLPDLGPGGHDDVRVNGPDGDVPMDGPADDDDAPMDGPPPSSSRPFAPDPALQHRPLPVADGRPGAPPRPPAPDEPDGPDDEPSDVPDDDELEALMAEAAAA